MQEWKRILYWEMEPVLTPEYEEGQRTAARWRPVLNALGELLDHADEHIPDLALAAISEDDLRAMAREQAAGWRVFLALIHHEEEREATPDEARAMCPRATLRHLRRLAGAARQHAAAIFATVGKGAPYADAFSLSRWTERQVHAAAYAAGQVLVTASGRTVSMSDVMNSSKKAALARVYAVVKGMDEVAQRDGWAAAFLTLTLPPEYHPNPSQGGQRYDPKLSPRKADSALSKLVVRLRARMAKAGIPTFGIRIYEPHQDGCPHSHILAYMPDDDVDRVDAILRDLRPEPIEGRRVATRCERIDRGRASPTTYAFKYLMKSMNVRPGTDVGDDDRDDGDHLSHHDRVRAWASERCIRRWGLWGTHGIQRAWQTLYQRAEMPDGTPEQVTDAWRAIHEGRQADALDSMGAVRGSGHARVRLAYEDAVTAYGDTRKKAVALTLSGTDWTMPLKGTDSRILSRADLRQEQQQRAEEELHEATVRRLQEWRAAHARGERIPHPVTVVGSYPRGQSDRGAEGEAGGRTGPPTPIQTTAEVRTAMA